MIWIPFFIAGLALLLANGAGIIDLNSHPLMRVFKWLLVAACVWALPLFVHRFLKFNLNPQLVNLWDLLILGFLLLWLIAALIRWIWRHYGPAPQGHRRCPRCRKPVLKVMLECPGCRQSL